MAAVAMSALTLGAILAASAAPKVAADAPEPKAGGEKAATKAGGEPAAMKTPKIKGTIKVEGNPSLAELKKKVKISQADAEKAALKAVGGEDSKKTTYSELEIEQGFLVYSIDVKIAGKDGVEEVWVDAGSGKVLAKMHEADDDDDEVEGEAGDDADDESD